MKLNIKAFALTVGLLWGLGVFFLTWWLIAFEGPSDNQYLINHIYRGYRMTPVGSLIGLTYGFFDGLFGGAIFAWLYNSLSSRFSKSNSAWR